MTQLFADTYFFFALMNVHEAKHLEALEYLRTFKGKIWTTQWVLTELADGMSSPRTRSAFVTLRNAIRVNPNVVIEPWGDAVFEQGINLYSNRPDKEWSLTDCISFIVMHREGIADALTGDHHFEQAGFNALFQ